jgi:endonuclease I
MRKIFGAVVVAALAGSALASDPFLPPPGYYDNAAGVGQTLKDNLRGIITSGHIRRSYGDARGLLQVTDEDPDDSDRIILAYTGASIINDWTSGATWNREHTWPSSRGLGSSSSFAYCDLHQLHPCNPSVNSSRGNKPFGSTSGAYWDPNQFGQQYRGRMARAMMYMDTRYTNLTLVEGFPSGSQMGALSEMLRWHFDEPPRELERRRNFFVDIYQRNRNPFIDHPEFVWAIFSRAPGEPAYPAAGAVWDNESTVFVGVSPSADGSSTLTLDLGDVLRGVAPEAEAVVLTKTGQTPTTYRVDAGGMLEADRGAWEAFGYDGQTQTVRIALAPDALDPLGVVNASVTIDNTDLTSAGLGMGAQDGDDVVAVSGRVVDPGAPSFDAGAVVASTTVDLGVARSSPRSGSATLYTLATTGGVYTSALSYTLGSAGGDTNAITLAPIPGAAVMLGDSVELVGTLDPAVGDGAYQASFVVEAAQAARGVSAPVGVTVTFIGVVSSDCPADLSGPALDGLPDGIVDAADLQFFLDVYVDEFGGAGVTDVTGPAQNGEPDGVVDASDLSFFLDTFVESLGVCP